MLNTTQINDNLEAAASCLQEVIALATECRQGILVPKRDGWTMEHSIEQRLRKIEGDARKMREYITWVYTLTERIASHENECYVPAV